MKAWYFSTEDRKLRHGDDRQIRTGRTHKVKGEIELCGNGLHASKRIIDALSYAPGPVIWQVELGGEIVTGDDKVCASERTYLWGYDASEVLRAFARKCALDVIHLWDAPEVVVTKPATSRHDQEGQSMSIAETVADLAIAAKIEPMKPAESLTVIQECAGLFEGMMKVARLSEYEASELEKIARCFRSFKDDYVENLKCEGEREVLMALEDYE